MSAREESEYNSRPVCAICNIPMFIEIGSAVGSEHQCTYHCPLCECTETILL